MVVAKIKCNNRQLYLENQNTPCKWEDLKFWHHKVESDIQVLEGTLGIIRVILISLQVRKTRLRLREIKWLFPNSPSKLMPELDLEGKFPHLKLRVSPTVLLWKDNRVIGLSGFWSPVNWSSTSQLCHLLTVWCWPSYVIFLNLSFFIYKNEIVIIANSKGYYED